MIKISNSTRSIHNLENAFYFMTVIKISDTASYPLAQCDMEFYMGIKTLTPYHSVLSRS